MALLAVSFVNLCSLVQTNRYYTETTKVWGKATVRENSVRRNLNYSVALSIFEDAEN